MPILTITGILIIALLSVLAVLSLKEGRWWLLPIDLLGVAGAAVAVGMELRGTETKVLTIATMSIITVVLIINVAVVFRDLRRGIGAVFSEPEMPRRGAMYRMIADEQEIRSEVNAMQDDQITEGLQALELWKAGNQAYQEGNFLDALSKYELSARWVPSVPAYVNASAACLELQKYEDAEQYASSALSLRDDCPEAWLNRGLACERMRDLQRALDAYRQVLRTTPEDAMATLLAGRALRRLGHLDEAEEVLDAGLQRKPDDPELLFEKSLVLIRKGRREEALPHLVETVKRNPKHYMAYFHLANTLNRLDRNSEALHYYDLVLKLKPDCPEAWNNRGIALSKLGKLKKAIQSYRKALTLRPQYHEAWINLALAHDTLGHREDALRAYRRFLDLAPASMAKHVELTARRVQELESQVEAGGSRKGKAKKLAETAEEAQAPAPAETTLPATEAETSEAGEEAEQVS